MKQEYSFRFLKWICPEHLHEEIEGDLIQKFRRDSNAYGEQKARRRLIWNVVRFLRPGIILRNKFSTELNHVPMIRNYFTVMFRNLTRRKFYAAVNVLCLTVGITFALLIAVFIRSELKVNKNLKDIDRLYLLQSKYKTSRGNFEWFVPGLLTKEAVEHYPTAFENYYRFFDRNITISHDDKHFRIQSMIGDPSFIDIFGFSTLHGDGKTSLEAPNSIVITDKIALKYFSKTDVVGETLSVATEKNGIKEFKITAVIAEPHDKNSVSDFMNMDAQVFLSLENIRDFFSQTDPNTWTNDIISYIKLSPSVNAVEASTILNEMLQKNAPQVVAETRDVALNSLKDYYLITNHGAVMKLIFSLTLVVVFILLLAVTNFINISISSSFSRLKEIGVRKVIGGIKNQIVIQFLLESVIYTLLAGFLALIFYTLLHNHFGKVLNATLPSVIQFDQTIWTLIIAGVFIIGILAGLYPALYQSAAKSIDSLKGKFKSVKGAIRFSRGLIATQFLITIFIFIGAVILSKQVSYFLEKDLGFDKAHVLIVTSVPRRYDEEGFHKMDAAKQEFLRSPKIQHVSLSWGAPGWNFSPQDLQVYRMEDSQEDGIRASLSSADEDYLKVYEIRLAEGEFLQSTQLDRLVINRTAQEALSVELGDKIRFGGDSINIFTVGGIVEDFNYESLHETVKPVVFMHNKTFQLYRFFSFKLEPGNLTGSVQEVEQIWKKVFPNDPFDYSFTDEKLQALYSTELQLKKASSIATILMIIIVLTGVLGLVSLNVSKRIKEIGIRKVLGASATNILVLLSREYAMLMVIAFLIATPLAYFAADYWLNNFAYHINLEWWMFTIPIVTLFTGIIVIVCVQSLRTALSNPVKLVRYE